MKPLDAADLEPINSRVDGTWEKFRNQHILITGGTGFIGKWLLESWAWANRMRDLGATAWVVSRNPEAFARAMPHLAHEPCFKFIRGDVRDFALTSPVKLTHAIHAATTTDLAFIAASPDETRDTIVRGTQHLLNTCAAHGAPEVLLVSSGAVYGPQPPTLAAIPESYTAPLTPTSPHAVYAEGKREAEAMCAAYGKTHGSAWKIARCFTFVGPYLPLTGSYAVGNFVRDARTGGPVRVAGDGTAWRSYLYAGDLAAWLWRILGEGASGCVYNVGSGDALTIADLARRVAALYKCDVSIARTAPPGAVGARYVPCVDRAREDLNLHAWTDLETALKRTEALLAS